VQKRESSREVRVADFVRDELSQIIRLEMRDPRVSFVSVNDVKVSRDLSYAEVYVSSYNTQTPEEQAELIAALNGAAGFFRSTLAKRHSMRTTPKPRFHYDKLSEEGPRLDALIQKAVAQDEANAASSVNAQSDGQYEARTDSGADV